MSSASHPRGERGDVACVAWCVPSGGNTRDFGDQGVESKAASIPTVMGWGGDGHSLGSRERRKSSPLDSQARTRGLGVACACTVMAGHAWLRGPDRGLHQSASIPTDYGSGRGSPTGKSRVTKVPPDSQAQTRGLGVARACTVMVGQAWLWGSYRGPHQSASIPTDYGSGRGSPTGQVESDAHVIVPLWQDMRGFGDQKGVHTKAPP